MAENKKVFNHVDVARTFADEAERTRKVGRVYLAHDEKVVDVLAGQSRAPVFSCCSWEFWCTFCGVCFGTCCFIATCCIKPFGSCKWNIHKEFQTTVLVLTNRRLIRYKESDGSASLKYPQRYTTQQIHLSAIGASTSHYAQALPGCLGRCCMLIGCCTCCHHMERSASLKFETKYPKPYIARGFDDLLAHSKFQCTDAFAPFRFLGKCIMFAIYAMFIQPGMYLFELIGMIKPSTEVIIFEEFLSSFRDRIENLGHDRNPDDVKRFDNFLKNFNIFRGQYTESAKIAPCNTDSFLVDREKSWEDAYKETDVFEGDRIFVNNHAVGLVSDETVIEAVDVTRHASCMDWLKCCCTCACYYCGFIMPMRAFKQFFVFTSHRAINVMTFSGKAASGRYGEDRAFMRTVKSFYDCVPTKGAKYEIDQVLCCAGGCCMTCCSCCNTPVRACMEIQSDFGTFNLNVTSRKPIYEQVEKLFKHLIKQYQSKTSFTADKLAPHVQAHFQLSNKDQVFNAECNEGKLGGKSLRDMMEPMVNDAESVHAGAYQFGDWALSGDAGGGETFFKKYVCPDKFQWHSGLVVTDSKILAYFIKNSSAERMSTIAITMIPVDKIKASSLFHTAQSFSYQCCECCIKIKNLTGDVPMNPVANLTSHHFGIMRAEIHVGTGSGTAVNFGQAAAAVATPANNMTATPVPMAFFGAELAQHSAGKGDLGDLSDKEKELERLYAVLNAASYLANEKAVKRPVDQIPQMVNYNQTPQAANGQ